MHEVICEFLKKIAHYPSITPPGREPCVLGGSARFDMYGSEFGLGHAVAVRTGYASSNKENGKVTANPGHEGVGVWI